MWRRFALISAVLLGATSLGAVATHQSAINTTAGPAEISEISLVAPVAGAAAERHYPRVPGLSLIHI